MRSFQNHDKQFRLIALASTRFAVNFESHDRGTHFWAKFSSRSIRWICCTLQDMEESVETTRQQEEMAPSTPPGRRNRKLLRSAGIDEPVTPCIEGQPLFHHHTAASIAPNNLAETQVRLPYASLDVHEDPALR